MKRRCLDPNSTGFENWGGRGISICERWMVFKNFLADMGHPPKGMSLDRIDNDGDYEPKNCRWATPAEQGNNCRNSKKIDHGGKSMGLRQWTRHLGLSPSTLQSRLKAGWPLSRALAPMA